MSLGDTILRMMPASVAARVRSIPLGNRLAGSAFWNLVGTVVARAMTFPVGILLARQMGREGYGELGIIYGTVELFGVFAGFGLSLTAMKYVAEFREKDPARAGRLMALSMVVTAMSAGVFALALFLFAPQLAAGVLAAPHLAGPLRIAALVLFLNVVDNVQGGSLSGFEAFKVLARLRLIKGLLDLPLMLGGYFLGGLTGVLWGALVSRAIGYVINRLALRAEARRVGVPFSFRNCTEELSVVWSFSLPALVSGALVSPVNWICAAMLVNQPLGYREMGAYSAASQWYNLIIFVPLAIGGGIIPILSDRLGNQDVQVSRDVLRFMLKLNAAIAIPAVIGLSALSPFIMAMYGRGYREAWPTLIAVVLTGAIFAILSPVGAVIAAMGRMWLGCFMNLGWAVVFIGTTTLLVRWGSLGLASARLIAYCVHAVWTFYFAYKLLSQARETT